jgi:hypothetical protein
MSIMEQELFTMCEKLTNKLHEYCNCHPTHDTDLLVKESKELMVSYYEKRIYELKDEIIRI